MRLLLLLMVGAMAVRAELLRVEFRFSDSGCASCTESLGDRLKRIRGVETAVVDGAKPVVRLTLAPGNRARLSVIQGRIEQDGTRVTDAWVDAKGSWRKAASGFEFVITGTGETLLSTDTESAASSEESVRERGRVTGFAEKHLRFTVEGDGKAKK